MMVVGARITPGNESKVLKLLEAVSKSGFWFNIKADPISTRRHTQVCRGLEKRIQHRDWVKR